MRGEAAVVEVKNWANEGLLARLEMAGSPFRARDDDRFWIVLRYVERNPLRVNPV
jgi:hypothetical protein